MDAHVKRRTPKEVVAERHGKGPQQTTMENRMRSEEERDKLRSYFARWAFESGIPFNALKLRSFEELVEAIGQYGPGFKPPSFHDYRVPLLKSEKEKVDEIKKKHKISWRKGCTLMSDGWTDRKGSHLINFLVNCTEGTFFLGSMDASSQIQDAKMLFELLDSRIEEIGKENVVQVVTDNASNYVAARRHARLLEAMRVQTKGADLVRAGVTRFASSFLTLQSLLKHKAALRRLFLSDHCLRASLPLLQVLRIVDGDERPALPEVYVAMEEAKKHIISNFKGIERKWKKIVKIIDRRWTSQMERPIYLAAFVLNPSKYFKAIEMESDESLANSLMHKANDVFNDVLRNRLEHQRLNDLVYIQYNRRLQVRFQERKEQSRNYDPLELDELDWSSEWMTGASDDELVHPGDDLTWRTVSAVTGVSSSFYGANRARRSGPSTAPIPPLPSSYSRRARGRVESSDEELEFGLELDEQDMRDDEDVEDDFGIESNDADKQQEQEDLNMLNWD
ncbi:uncharacterized protein LOC122655330 [Telopea speciosissima]|uniref:uncharacterized protein LOC122655330 n=1 Tax=Telopea speciosissima TaxID=54955 RepID=UPI001CC71EC6|nr:uncharacterized protein LOC122655330 [Telopea speciosissima]